MVVRHARSVDGGDNSKGESGASDQNGLEHPPDRLFEEYKLIQGKIDKIGDFQFKFKGWSATLLGALLYGGFSTSNLITAIYSGVVVAIMFHISETRQRWLGKRLGRRAIAIEQALRSFPPANSVLWAKVQRENPAMRFAPAIARTMADRSPPRESRKNRLTRMVGWIVMQSNDVFYCAQYFLLVSLLVTHFVSSHLKRLGPADDPAPRYQITLFGHDIIVYRRSK
jgi:hypothetical protein